MSLMNLAGQYKITDNDNEQITIQDYEVISNIVKQQFPQVLKSLVYNTLKHKGVTEMHKSGKEIFVISYYPNCSFLSASKGDEIKKEFESKTKLKLERV